MLFDDYNTDGEPDFTGLDVAAVSHGPDEGAQCDDDRLSRRYVPEDLVSVETDPACKDDWFLAHYWPVYVGNFKVEEWEPDTWHEQISNYFAYKGLLTRMVYVHYQANYNLDKKEQSKDFSTYQRRCMLIDMLVYFASKDDAERAMATCHRESYYGYKLNVLPGREPVYFDNERSCLFTDFGKSCVHTPLETVIDQAMSNFGKVSFAARYPNGCIVVEFVSTQAMLAGISSQVRFKPTPLNRDLMKQRFLEEDVKLDLEWARESDPAFMTMQPKASVLVQLYEGVRPNVSISWKGHERFVKAPALLKARNATRNNMRMLFERKKNKNKKPKQDEAETLPAPTNQYKERKKQNMKTINWFLRTHGAAPINNGTVREAKKKVHPPPLQKKAK